MYSYGNILPRNYVSYIFKFQLVPFAFSAILGNLFMVYGDFSGAWDFMQSLYCCLTFLVVTCTLCLDFMAPLILTKYWLGS